MLKGFYQLLLMFSLVFSVQIAFAAPDHDGSKKITLTGNLQGKAFQRVSIKTIETVGLKEFSVYNPYEKKVEDYTGVLLDEFVKHFGKPGISKLIFRAIDDYSIEISKQDWTQFRILLATRTNGDYIGYASRGPVRVIFPDYDKQKPIYEPHLSKWAWMINHIEFK